jgi:hypothetical protein
MPERLPSDWILQQWQYFGSEGALLQADTGQKIEYWNLTSTLFTWFSSQLLAPKNKVCLNEINISGYWNHPNKCDDGTESYSITEVPKMFPTVAGSIVGLSAQLLKGKYFESDTSQ